MNTLKNIPLASYVTMKIGGPAKEMITVNNEQEVIDAVDYANEENLKILTLGSGSNIVFKDSGFDGLIIVNKIKGQSIDVDSGLVEFASGAIWDDLVKIAIENGLCGVESMSYIPGTVGAAPINNIGAYGQELSDILYCVRAYDCKNKKYVEILKQDCDFDYRHSRFKSRDYGRFIITKVSLKLPKTPLDYKVPQYQAVIDKLNNDHISNPQPFDVRKALKTIRGSKLPDPYKLANSGSFFKNPIVTQEKANELLNLYPNLPTYPQKDGNIKLAAGWLIEQAGLKNYRQNGMWVYQNQALVLVNEAASGFKDLESMKDYIVQTVQDKYGVNLVNEPEIL